MAVVESANGVDLAVAAGPSITGSGATDPRSAKDLVSTSASSGHPALRPHRDPSAAAPAASSFHGKPPLALGLNRDGPSAAVVGSQGEGFKREMRDLEELLSKLNPMAEEFVPPSLAGMGNRYGAAGGGLYASGFEVSNGVGDGGAVGNDGRRVRVSD